MENGNFSEQKIKRFIGNKRIVSLSISLIIACILSGIFGISFVMIDNKYNNLSNEYNDLTRDYEDISEEYNDLTGDYEDISEEYNKLIVATLMQPRSQRSL